MNEVFVKRFKNDLCQFEVPLECMLVLNSFWDNSFISSPSFEKKRVDGGLALAWKKKSRIQDLLGYTTRVLRTRRWSGGSSRSWREDHHDVNGPMASHSQCACNVKPPHHKIHMSKQPTSELLWAHCDAQETWFQQDVRQEKKLTDLTGPFPAQLMFALKS